MNEWLLCAIIVLFFQIYAIIKMEGYVYFVNDKFVYVCIILDIAKYKVITAFKLN